MARHIRWSVNTSKWKPTRDEWLKLTSSVDLEEVERINKFVYQDDAKSSLVGQALIRKFLSVVLGKPSRIIKLARSQHGKPEISHTHGTTRAEDWPKLLDFNVSHSGDYCVLAGFYAKEEPDKRIERVRIGVDVTKIVSKSTKEDLNRFLSLMSRREFTRNEWSTVDGVESDRQKCINFTRLWCLKESFIKALGLGLSFRLDRIDFKFGARVRYNLSVDELRGKPITDTTVELDKELARDWSFVEFALDGEHLVALAYNVMGYTDLGAALDFVAPWTSQGGSLFEELCMGDLVDSLSTLREPDESDWELFSCRETRKYCKKS